MPFLFCLIVVALIFYFPYFIENMEKKKKALAEAKDSELENTGEVSSEGATRYPRDQFIDSLVKCMVGVKAYSSLPIISIAVNATVGMLVFSLIALLVNLSINNEAFQFQWGMRRHVDTALLNDYKFIRNMFMGIGLVAGVVSAFVPKK